MGYNLCIGNATLLESDGEWEADVTPVGVPNPLVIPGDTEAPMRHPGYLQWREFTRQAGLEDMFYNEFDGLLRRHPGCFLLTQDHLTKVRAALEIARRKYPNDPIGFPVRTENESEEDFERREEECTEGTGALVRLTWLEFWIDAALKHCERPAFYNS
jgi:hypothetical protein